MALSTQKQIYLCIDFIVPEIKNRKLVIRLRFAMS